MTSRELEIDDKDIKTPQLVEQRQKVIQLKEKIQEMQMILQDNLCVYCLDRKKECLFANCCHLASCLICVTEKIAQKGKKSKRINDIRFKSELECPVCFTLNTEFLKVLN